MTLAPARNHPINCGTATTPSFSRVFAKRSISDAGFAVSTQQVKRITVPGTISSVTVDDATYVRNTSSTYETDYQPVAVQTGSSLANRPIEYDISSLDPGVLSQPNQSGVMSYQATGTGRIQVVSSEGETAIVPVSVAAVAGGTVDTFSSYAEDSLAYAARQAVAGRMTTLARNVYSSRGGSGSYVRNPSAWASGIDWSCVSPWNSSGGYGMAGTLVTSRHALFCRHASYYPKAGAAIKFVGMDGQSWDTTIESTTEDTGAYSADFAVARLASAAPAYISPAKILGGNWQDYLPTVPVNERLTQSWEPKTGAELSVVYFTQDATVNAMEWREVLDSPSYGQPITAPQRLCMSEPQGSLAPYYQAVRLGDSGQPIFLVVGSEPVLLSVFTSIFSGTFIPDAIAIINSMISALGGGGQLTTVDLSDFPTY